MTALDPKADIRLVLVVMTANDPKRTVENRMTVGTNGENSELGLDQSLADVGC